MSINPIQYCVLVPMMSGYSATVTENEHGEMEPDLFDTHEAGAADLAADFAEHQARIDEGDLDPEEVFELELWPVRREGDVLCMLDAENGFSEVARFNWRAEVQ
ncbi:hypothetical protein [Aliagarivorans taiwanensis]|uniref:hypothetical protein n=1 Tax=Aliagarivorans taiwanensis TaxID=561966 RepID=UPI0003F538D7|nr:hypothetical protein [Aliagarivorans taiwanensis]